MINFAYGSVNYVHGWPDIKNSLKQQQQNIFIFLC